MWKILLGIMKVTPFIRKNEYLDVYNIDGVINQQWLPQSNDLAVNFCSMTSAPKDLREEER